MSFLEDNHHDLGFGVIVRFFIVIINEKRYRWKIPSVPNSVEPVFLR